MKVLSKRIALVGLCLAITLGASAEADNPDNAGIGKLTSNEEKVEILPSSTTTFDLLESENDREGFLAVEHFARLPKEEQSALLPDFYRQLPPRTLNGIVEMSLSSFPHDIINRYQKDDAYDGNTDLWAQQLADASLELSAEEVADNLERSLWLKVASRARALWVLKQHPEKVAALISDDLNSRDQSAIDRAAGVVQALNLTDFSDRLLEIWIGGNQDEPSPIWSALLFMDHSRILSPLLKRVQEDPKFLIRCAGLLQGPLYGKPAEPLLLSLLDATDPEIRYNAAYALMECVDEQLARPVEKMAVDPDARIRFIAAHQIPKLPLDAFQSVREQMLPLLNDPDEEIHFYALLGFGKRKDLAAGPIILETLRQEQLAEQYKVWTMQALGALSGGTWDYDMHQWGPQRPGNQQAIEQFEVWLNKQQKELSWGEPLNGLRCRWVDVPLEVEVGTAPMVSVEIENVRNQPIIWKCQSGITWGFKRSELSTILADFTIQLGQGVRPATTTEITGATLSDSAKDYYRLEAGGKLVLTARLPFTLDKVGETKIGCEVARLDPTTSVDHPLNGFTCPPLLIDVAEPPQHTDAAGAVPSAPGE